MRPQSTDTSHRLEVGKPSTGNLEAQGLSDSRHINNHKTKPVALTKTMDQKPLLIGPRYPKVPRFLNTSLHTKFCRRTHGQGVFQRYSRVVVDEV